MKKNIILFSSLIALSAPMTSPVFAGGLGGDDENRSTTSSLKAGSPQTDSSEVFPATKRKPGWIEWLTAGIFGKPSQEEIVGLEIQELQSVMERLSRDAPSGWSTRCVQFTNTYLAANDYSESCVDKLLNGWFGTSSYNSIRKNVLEEVQRHRLLNKREQNTLNYATRTIRAAKRNQ